jgi:hypothetical protein
LTIRRRFQYLYGELIEAQSEVEAGVAARMLEIAGKPAEAAPPKRMMTAHDLSKGGLVQK